MLWKTLISHYLRSLSIFLANTFNRAGQRLAPGFETVSVGNSKLAELRLLGIDYFEGEDGARYTGRGGREDDDSED